MPNRVFGHIEGFPVGSYFLSRSDLSEAGVHRPTQAGIGGSEKEGADSIVLSGGYEDDEDWGDEILYTGQGGRDVISGRQIDHQPLNRGNLALAKSKLNGLPVRVIRGAGQNSRFAPEIGYRYDGLYSVEDYWQERGRSGHYVWRYLLRRVDEGNPLGVTADERHEYRPAKRTESTTQRIVRDTQEARRVKELHGYRCQVCGIRIEGTAGPYAEAAHIRPLGRPHHGSDTADNIICLCPNHHVLFDYGGFTIADDLSLIGIGGMLRIHSRHRLSVENIQYHREHYFYNREQT